MDHKIIVLVTGANTGLGFEMIRALCSSEKAYEVLVGGRSLVKAEQATNAVSKEIPSTRSRVWPVQVDIEDDESIQSVFDEVQTKFGRLDALVNNAGAQFDQQFLAGHLTMRQAWNASWNVNTVGTQIMTATFVPLLLKSEDPRLLFMASGTSSLKGTENPAMPFNKVPAGGWPKEAPTAINNIPAYRSSKCGMNMMMREWYRILREDGVKVWCISPGFLATGLGGDQEVNKSLGAGDPATAGQFVRTVLEGQRDDDVGRVLVRDGVQPW
ncbi:hypothetical protein P7C71_g2642, partial [Lecanoromycetidae sp. Uapishka_2]